MAGQLGSLKPLNTLMALVGYQRSGPTGHPSKNIKKKPILPKRLISFFHSNLVRLAFFFLVYELLNSQSEASTLGRSTFEQEHTNFINPIKIKAFFY